MGCFFGNDSVLQLGMLFLVYMIQMSTNITHPRAWIYTQFAIANIASAILVSSNTTNVVIAQAFQIGFAEYTANLIVPVIIAAIILFPFLLYVVFAHRALIPTSIQIHELPIQSRDKKPVNPNLPVELIDEEREAREMENQGVALLTLNEILNPFLDMRSALVGIIIMIMTLIVLLALTAANLNFVPVVWATLPAAFLMFCWDIISGWLYRRQTREISEKGRQEVWMARLERMVAERLAWEEQLRQNADVGRSNANRVPQGSNPSVHGQRPATSIEDHSNDHTRQHEGGLEKTIADEAALNIQTTNNLAEESQNPPVGESAIRTLEREPSEARFLKLQRRTGSWEQYARIREFRGGAQPLAEVEKTQESEKKDEISRESCKVEAPTSTTAHETKVRTSPVRKTTSHTH